MTGDEYAQLGEDIQDAIGAVIQETAPAAKVLTEDPVNIDESLWVGSLKSGEDLDAEGQKRIHAWILTFVAPDDPDSSTVRSIEPAFVYRVQVFYSHDVGSEKRIRDEVLKVQFALAQNPKLEVVGVNKHTQLRIRLRLGKMRGASGDVIVHRGDGSLSVEMQPIAVR
ncbi:MAG TPA: hypothetical protein VGB17_02885 [Pyrinomonadaceae bacterium]|jgi:hypothetical protein